MSNTLTTRFHTNASKVFVLADTLRNHTQEEKNIQYVAITRAKQTLVMVSDKERA